ncbi:uncharacterized protein SCHCODRAFT_02194478 [Schizophyllum commune H4-8]|uniref:uncharacterized protein n=1 Tax=Schizophyllum commune (strain H4-8 / FGSC 9210) TaxID=578458 RepID=UPI00215EE980|nr:uncharacterized protein SCHCODRAFT_02194478 [Schizophyllum commune H4-8]KAI5896591.1 hypothetical protein SCHCODRAFT_02194478 [Schizophyllum commune H4-8]
MLRLRSRTSYSSRRCLRSPHCKGPRSLAPCELTPLALELTCVPLLFLFPDHADKLSVSRLRRRQRTLDVISCLGLLTFSPSPFGLSCPTFDRSCSSVSRSRRFTSRARLPRHRRSRRRRA